MELAKDLWSSSWLQASGKPTAKSSATHSPCSWLPGGKTAPCPAPAALQPPAVQTCPSLWLWVCRLDHCEEHGWGQEQRNHTRAAAVPAAYEGKELGATAWLRSPRAPGGPRLPLLPPPLGTHQPGAAAQKGVFSEAQGDVFSYLATVISDLTRARP